MIYEYIQNRIRVACDRAHRTPARSPGDAGAGVAARRRVPSVAPRALLPCSAPTYPRERSYELTPGTPHDCLCPSASIHPLLASPWSGLISAVADQTGACCMQARAGCAPLVRPNPYATRAIPSSVRANPLSPSPRLRRAPARSHPRAPRGALTRQTRRRPSPPIRTGAPKEHVPARTGVDSTPGHAKEAPRRRPRARARAPHTLA